MGTVHTSEDRDAVLRLRQQIETIPDSAFEVRSLLGTVLDVLGRAKPTDIVGAVGPLLAYGAYLDSRNQYRLGQHVLSIVTETLDSPVGSTDLFSVAVAYLEYGRFAHRLGEVNDAEFYYARGLTIATQSGDDDLKLYAKICLGRLRLNRGDFVGAESLLDTVIAEARRNDLPSVEACALQLRGSLLLHSKRPVDAIRDFSIAYSLTPNRSLRELLLGDLAACATVLGLWQAACAIQEKLARTAHDRIARAYALVNLVELAILRGDHDQYRARWQQVQAYPLATMPPLLNLYAQFYAANGVERFESVSAALATYRTLSTRAKELGNVVVERLIRERLDTVLAREQPQS
ncbi:MAG TPA: hypothetical protein VNU46_08245 [Gemmatimonadaceae bacterium]|nr:hypothetical protein [Gemmatimonadaceae bacterium]